MKPMLRRFLVKWLARHATPGNRVLHVLGIGGAFVAAPAIAVFWRRWWLALGVFVVGYVLQIVGHLMEGSPVGEWLLVKRVLGLGGKSSHGKNEDAP
jgi:hypothetical protein